MLFDVAADGLLEVGDGLEGVAADASAGDDGEEALDGVKLGGGGGGEMEDPTRMIGQPFLDLGVLVGGVVVGNGMDDLSRRDGPLDGFEWFNALAGDAPSSTGPRVRYGALLYWLPDRRANGAVVRLSRGTE